jgi:hypothetical protein
LYRPKQSQCRFHSLSIQWTLEMQGQSRFVFEQDGAVRRIRDQSDSRTSP